MIMELDFFLSDTFKSFKDVKAKIDSLKIWDFSWINLLRLNEQFPIEDNPVYVNRNGKLIFEYKNMKKGKLYEVNWEKMNLLLKKEEDKSITFYEILSNEAIDFIKECIKKNGLENVDSNS